MSDDQDNNQPPIGQKTTVTLFDHSTCQVLKKLPLPGVIIEVHGVNSDGEWYEEAEQGVCKGLNTRLARNDKQLAHPGIEAGKLFPATYTSELTDAGFINRKRKFDTFIDDKKENYSPVVRFRWGYRANDDELKTFGENVWLNEDNYWGGGPFPNGCASLPDLWGSGLNDSLFLWLTIQHINPAAGRDVYGMPPRAYYVHAAWRLAKLVELIRSKQADIPITIVCHSQGNMVSLAAAFLGEQWPEVTDRQGKSGNPVADSYVMCNPPYSLRGDSMGTDNWGQRRSTNSKGESGRETTDAREKTLKHFFSIIRQRAAITQSDVDDHSANMAPQDGSVGYKDDTDAAKFGLNNKTRGRVTLYCNPGDQLISASVIQGLGWMGMSDKQISATEGKGVFTQRVWAQGFEVGKKGVYDYWANHWKNKDAPGTLKPGSHEFWHPPSPIVKYSIKQGLESDKNWIAKIVTVVTAPVMYVVLAAVKVRVNALPPDDWKIPIEAPELDAPAKPFLPTTKVYGKEGLPDQFDSGADPPAAYRDKNKANPDPNDPYDSYTGDSAKGEDAQGSADSEAEQRYEDRGRMRMIARREGKTDDNNKVVGEDDNAQPDAKWTAWHNENVTKFMKEGADQNATDHSTIMTNSSNMEKALAYDVAIGYSLLTPEDWQEIRVAADWRLLKGLPDEHPHRKFDEYIQKGTLNKQALHEHSDYVEKAMPKTIIDERENKPPVKREH